ncbi:type I polyketide synthase [Shumkonia mesophila]|uniref:type I polyketide synthase n=1 Tax=Shumkonia mesophila TaxID=2838854 RepID=UPI0029352EF9|nr:type I polyketide synthase [Shumkonia mesophila]
MMRQRNDRDHIAVVGMSCRFPGGANSPAEFWRILSTGLDVIGDVPASRWDKLAYYDPDVAAPGKMCTTRGGFMDVPVDRFDPAFFNISPKEAADMDPQQRILLELCWEAFEDAGMPPLSLRGSDTGVFIGVSSTDYSDIGIHDNILHATSYSLTGSCYSALAGRVSFVFGLEGPSLAIDTACSSSMVAIDNACSCLRLGRTGLAVAGGFNLMLSPDMQICLTKLRALSPDGLCKSFDADAKGYARAEGGGLVVLKRLSDALAAGDRILGVIRGSFVNQDGESTGISAPNGRAQEKVILGALREAGLDPAEVDYIETHGTGTRVGDRTELTAIGHVMEGVRGKENPLVVGSVKSNIGHLEAASGIAGLEKVLLAFRYGVIPGNLHFDTPNPAIEWDRWPVEVASANHPWPRSDKPRIAGVSSFGFVGTNAHLVIEEPPALAQRHVAERSHHTLLLSARTPDALRTLIRRYVAFLKDFDGDDLADICHTATIGRSHLEYRVAVTGEDKGGILDGLADLLEQEDFAHVGRERGVAFLYTGQGAQYVGMGGGLFRTQPEFRRAMEECDAIYRQAEGASLIDLLYGEDATSATVDNTRYSQPLLFAVEYALTRLWRSFGVEPAVVIGHSVGEYVAACVAGVFDLEDALRLVSLRGRLMGSAPGRGIMVAVSAAPNVVVPLLGGRGDRVSPAAFNSPDNTVISGFADAMEPILEELEKRGLRYQELRVSHAFHSPQMEPVLDEFRRAVSAVTLREPRIPLISNATAAIAGPGLLTDPEYWVRHLRGTVRMSESLESLRGLACAACLEVGPRPTLLSFAERCLGHDRPRAAASTRFRVPDFQALGEAAGELYQAGVDLDWAAWDAPFGGRKVALPTHPFGGQRHWVERSEPTVEPRSGASVVAGHPIIGQRLETPALPGAVIFQADVSRGRHHFFPEHVILGVETAPGAALLSWIWLAGRELFADEPFRLTDIQLIQPLILFDADRTVQIVVRDVNRSRCSFELLSREGGSDGWVKHCEGWIERGEPPLPGPSVDLDALSDRLDFRVSGAEFYATMSSLGYEYGPLFRCVEEAGSAGDDILGGWRVPERDARTRDYWITPGELDTIFQTPAVALMGDGAAAPDEGLIHIPFYVKSLTVHRPFAPGLSRVHTRTEATKAAGGGGSVESSMRVYDERGQLVVSVEGFVSAAVSRQALRREESLKQLRRLVYIEEWPREALHPTGEEEKPRAWVLFGEPHPALETLAARLPGRVFRLEPAERPEDRGGRRFGVDWEKEGALAEAFARLGLEGGDPVAVVHMRPAISADFGRNTSADLVADADRRLQGALALTKALASATFPARLWIVTTGDRLILDEDAGPRLRAGGLDGFTAVAALEMADRRPTHVDLSPDPDEVELAALAAEMTADGPESRVCLRGDRRFVARFTRRLPGGSDEAVAPREPYTLEIGGGGLDDMRLVPQDRREPGPGEVEFEIVATGVNFKDVLRSLGELSDTANRVGGEAAGVVTRVGAGVDDLRPGDAVISRDMAGGGFSAYQTSQRRFLTRKPDFLTFEEAATISIAFMTARHGLFELGKLQKGERVLIHAGAGGVGLAAVQQALNAGAEVFATAGSRRKRDYLTRIGAHHVFNSRSLDFADEVRRLTGGRGVHVVLNSLTGEHLRRSLLLLVDGGRFLELGKREILSEEAVREIHPTARYQAFDLTDVVAGSADGRADMMAAILREMESGALFAPPVRVFPVERASDAFRFMSRALHIGRVALSHRAEIRGRGQSGEKRLRADGVYLITGGLGALGLEFAEWLAAGKVGGIVLTGRRAPSEEAAARIEAMRAGGTEVTAVRCDIADPDDVRRLMEGIDGSPLALRGVIHAAGILDDRTIARMDWERFTTVLRPKMLGAWNLHLATLDRPLDFFVVFSSAAATLGNRGQVNYAAGNAFMNALVDHRRSLGLSGTAVCWGPFADVGMAATGSEAGERMAKNGILGIKPADGVAVLAAILKRDIPVTTVADMDWGRFLETVPGDIASTLFSRLAVPKTAAAPERAPGAEEAGAGSPAERIRAATPEERPAAVLTAIRRIVAKVMGHEDASAVPTDTSLMRLGLDSLMAMDFRNRVEKRLSVSVPFGFLAEQASLETIAADIVKEIGA